MLATPFPLRVFNCAGSDVDTRIITRQSAVCTNGTSSKLHSLFVGFVCQSSTALAPHHARHSGRCPYSLVRMVCSRDLFRQHKLRRHSFVLVLCKTWSRGGALCTMKRPSQTEESPVLPLRK